MVVRGTLMQTLTPDEMRGRVAAVNSVFISSSNELGAFESGMTAALFGPVASVVGGGVGTIVVVLMVAVRWPRLLGLGPLHLYRPINEAALGSAADAAAEEWKGGQGMRTIHDLTTEEAYRLVAEHVRPRTAAAGRGGERGLGPRLCAATLPAAHGGGIGGSGADVGGVAGLTPIQVGTGEG